MSLGDLLALSGWLSNRKRTATFMTHEEWWDALEDIDDEIRLRILNKQTDEY